MRFPETVHYDIKIQSRKYWMDGRSKHAKISFTLLAMAYIADVGAAHAYIDPGVGSLLLQGAVGGVATFLVVMRLYGAKAKKAILALLGRAPAQADRTTHAPE
jgi:hypothetical protein